jgi:hypothetical protein
MIISSWFGPIPSWFLTLLAGRERFFPLAKKPWANKGEKKTKPVLGPQGKPTALTPSPLALASRFFYLRGEFWPEGALEKFVISLK